MTAVTGALLAHQGGWDEALLAIVPLVVVGALLLLANRRAKRSLAERAAGAAASTAEREAEPADGRAAGPRPPV